MHLQVAFKHHESTAGPSFRLTIPQGWRPRPGYLPACLPACLLASAVALTRWRAVIYEAIAREADVDFRSRMLEQVKNYWMMKRYSRQGAPLLRRLQVASLTWATCAIACRH